MSWKLSPGWGPRMGGQAQHGDAQESPEHGDHSHVEQLYRSPARAEPGHPAHIGTNMAPARFSGDRGVLICLRRHSTGS